MAGDATSLAARRATMAVEKWGNCMAD